MIKSKVILITGGTGKVGLNLVQFYLADGWTVITISRSADKILNLNKLLAKFVRQKKFFVLPVDLETSSAADEIIVFCKKQKLWPQALINNARNLDYVKDVSSLVPISMWVGEYVLDVVVPYTLSMRLAEHSSSQLQTVVNISSMYGVVAVNPNLYENSSQMSPIQYSVAKAGLIHLTKELAVRLAKRKVCVNAVSFGGIEGRVDVAFKERYAQLCPQEKMLAEGDVVGAVKFLTSEDSRRMTGQNIIVDGGWTAW